MIGVCLVCRLILMCCLMFWFEVGGVVMLLVRLCCMCLVMVVGCVVV